jgi:DNA-binding transcriptional LysR family regulator
VSLLEEELGVQLFDRIGRNVKLNEVGQYAFQKFQSVDVLLEETVKSVREYGDKGNKKIRMGFFSALPKKEMITPIINSVLTNIPDVGLKLELIDLGDALKLLLNDKLDITFTNLEDGEELEQCKYIVFAKKPAKIVVAPNHPWYQKSEITVKDMEEGTIIKLENADTLPHRKEHHSLYDRIICKDEIWVSNFNTMYTLLEQGKAFAVFPNAFANVDGVNFHFFDIPQINVDFLTVGIYKENNRNPCVKQVLELLTNELKSYNI